MKYYRPVSHNQFICCKEKNKHGSVMKHSQFIDYRPTMGHDDITNKKHLSKDMHLIDIKDIVDEDLYYCIMEYNNNTTIYFPTKYYDYPNIYYDIIKRFYNYIYDYDNITSYDEFKKLFYAVEEKTLKLYYQIYVNTWSKKHFIKKCVLYKDSVDSTET